MKGGSGSGSVINVVRASESGVGDGELVWDFNSGAEILGFDAFGGVGMDFGMLGGSGGGEAGGGIDLNQMILNAMPTATASPRTKQRHPHDDGLNEFWFKDRNGTPMDITRAMELYTTPSIIHSPAMEKQVIYSTFMDTYLPQRIGEQDAHFSFLQQLIQTPNLRPEVSAGLDAMSLVQVGSIFKDQNLLKQAVKAYHRAISGLLKTFQSKDTEFATDDYVLATVTVLANCEFFDEISQVGDGWTKHIEGQQQLLAARGPASIQSNLSLLLYSNMRHGALSHALLVRKACFMGTEEWRSVAWRAPYVDAATIFYDSALQVPAILERYDQLKAEDGVGKIDAILKDAAKLEQEMRTWFGGYQIRSKWNEHKLFELAPLEAFGTFSSLCPDRTLEEACVFPTFMVSYLICVYWDVTHFLRTSPISCGRQCRSCTWPSIRGTIHGIQKRGTKSRRPSCGNTS
ncbi:hypothetical protein CLAFUW4_10016 [Fulvia fulva]|uniref:Uncharacterized protein n=1 Tax=Passalora fulva TaxID=5499 RepID=A0A9Q8PHI4_PASFU|nr:uncharacterized protein CLAFUR5_12228 [Fulvia fulva]KAK4616232.1 hypothetical protein CLAFUR4_10020 [Fulvia fulva]KAK4617218.1 hypothetical protein CLAFUR0_10018 [Fulvia fulva]UJO22534.1 hypothetical protein CLAFUR5_12228 [Fulvia fulva]WPV19435.1 hypothetical protein CLAFUW4_10016 [Fulvia fulva]WPV34064.1 hypothetical protein CLAFUW7_10017 [Fulvia fulva]